VNFLVAIKFLIFLWGSNIYTVPFTTDVVSLYLDQGEVYNIV